MVDLYNFVGLIFADAHPHIHYVLYNRAYLWVYFSWLGDHPWKPRKLDPSKISCYMVFLIIIIFHKAVLQFYVHEILFYAFSLLPKIMIITSLWSRKILMIQVLDYTTLPLYVKISFSLLIWDILAPLLINNNFFD